MDTLQEKPNGSLNRTLFFIVVIGIIGLNALGPYFGIQKVFTFGIIPFLTLISLTIDFRTFYKDNYEFLMFFLIVAGSVSSVFYYIDIQSMITGLSALIGALMCSYIPLALNRKHDYSDSFNIGYILSILLLIWIMYSNGNFDFSSFATKVDYRDRFLLNANFYSYISYFANFSLFYLHQKYKKNYLVLFLLLSCPILFIIISFVTQSRSGLILIGFINLIYWVFVQKPNTTSRIKKHGRYAMIALVLIVLSIQFIGVYNGSRIKSRVDSSVSKGDSREVLILESFEAFKSNPFLGVGLNQLPYYTTYGQFSHNSYVEILAEQGIIGGILLFGMFMLPLYKAFRNLRREPTNNIFRINMLFFTTFYLFNNAYPFYKYPFSMLYFFFVISMQKKIDVKQRV